MRVLKDYPGILSPVKHHLLILMNPSRGNESSHISHSLYTIGNQKIRDETTTRRKSKLLYSTWSRNSTIRSRQIVSGQIRSDRVRLGQVGSDIAGEVPTFQRDTLNLLVIKWKTANPKISKYSWGKGISAAWKHFCGGSYTQTWQGGRFTIDI